MDNYNTSFTFRILNRFRLLTDVQKHGNITLFGLIKHIISTFFRRLIFTYAYKGYFLEPFNKKFIRPCIWKACGCHLGKNVHIGHMVRLDFGNADKIFLDDNVVLSNGVTILCHKRDVSDYHIGDVATKLPFIYKNVHIKEGAQVGINCTIMPGVTIGKGSIIGTCSLVTKDIPDWCVAVGSPCKPVKFLSES